MNTTSSASVVQKFASLRKELNAVFPERSDVIDGALTSMVAGEHVLMVGPPGTAKSALVRAVAGAFDGRYFERLMTKFSTPEELFGPVSLRALEQDRFERVTTKKLPEAEIAFVDEVFKSNSAILNSLLTIMNERLFHNDGNVMNCPLVSMFGASNELPEGKELEALYDRFMMRFNVNYLVNDSSIRTMLKGATLTVETKMNMEDLRAAQKGAAAVTVTPATVEKMLEVRSALKQAGVHISDRRFFKAQRLLKAAAWLAGSVETAVEDIGILVDAFWSDPADRTKVAKKVGEITDPTSLKVQELMDSARETFNHLSGIDPKAAKAAYTGAAAKALNVIQDIRARAKSLSANEGSRRLKTLSADAIDDLDVMEQQLVKLITDAFNGHKVVSVSKP
jgi:MoxR-like ATPase